MRQHLLQETAWLRFHSEKFPHWSENVEWRPGRWDPLSNAPVLGSPVLWVRGRTEDGHVIERMHYACGDGDGLIPPFDGWFTDDGYGGFVQVFPVEWQPLRALPKLPDTISAQEDLDLIESALKIHTSSQSADALRALRRVRDRLQDVQHGR